MTVTLPTVSIVVPIYNEKDNIEPLIDQIEHALNATGLTYEAILIDDGSTDQSAELLQQLQPDKPWLKIILFRRNFGQTAAMAAGFDHARGDIVIPLDGDLQNDPADIPRLIDKLNQGYDVVSGWRQKRQDKFITRKIPSWIANRLIGKITGVHLHDYGCSLKAYRKEVIQHMNLYGDMHRFIPAVAQWYGASVTEMPVNHRPRTRGKTKYGLNRTFKVILDLLTIKFLGSFSTRPLHVFGGMGLVAIVSSFISAAIAIFQKFYSHLNLNRNPLILLTILLMLAGLQFILMGLLAEMLARTYHESQKKPIYIIRKIIATPADSGEPIHD